VKAVPIGCEPRSLFRSADGTLLDCVAEIDRGAEWSGRPRGRLAGRRWERRKMGLARGGRQATSALTARPRLLSGAQEEDAASRLLSGMQEAH